MSIRELAIGFAGLAIGCVLMTLLLGRYETRLLSNGALAVRLNKLTGELEWCTVETNPAKATFCYPERRP